MQVQITSLIDDGQCFDTVRELRWPEGRECPFCDSKVSIQGVHSNLEKFSKKLKS